MNTTEKLLPCPFCGVGSERIILGVLEPHTHAFATFMPDHPGSATIECGGCNVGMIDDTVDEVIAAWNARAQPNCGACPGDGSICQSACKLAEESPPAMRKISYKAEDGRFLDQQGWSAGSDSNDCTASIPIHENGKVIALAVVRTPCDDYSNPQSELERICTLLVSSPVPQADAADSGMNLNETFIWIPVSERLPDSDITVQLFNAAADEPVWLGYHDASDNCWYYVDAEEAAPTHWAEMPEGPTA